MAAPICDNASLRTGAVCFINGPQSPFQQKALLVYAKALQLAAIGGTDYTEVLSTTLLADASALACGMDEPHRIAAYINLAFLNAASAGATVPASIQDKADAVRCLINADPEALDEADLLLTCQLGYSAAYPQ